MRKKRVEKPPKKQRVSLDQWCKDHDVNHHAPDMDLMLAKQAKRMGLPQFDPQAEQEEILQKWKDAKKLLELEMHAFSGFRAGPLLPGNAKRPAKLLPSISASSPPSSSAEEFPVVVLSVYQEAKELESLGMEWLKAELDRTGLKSGGSLRQRAERLWLLKDGDLTTIPSKHLSKAGKTRKTKDGPVVVPAAKLAASSRSTRHPRPAPVRSIPIDTDSAAVGSISSSLALAAKLQTAALANTTTTTEEQRKPHVADEDAASGLNPRRNKIIPGLNTTVGAAGIIARKPPRRVQQGPLPEGENRKPGQKTLPTGLPRRCGARAPRAPVRDRFGPLL